VIATLVFPPPQIQAATTIAPGTAATNALVLDGCDEVRLAQDSTVAVLGST
jgi:hypothetical protein